jgi:hypothetical protein
MLEGILSHMWQGWCHFCRNLIIESCKGTTDMSGNLFPQLGGALSDQHVSAAAIRIKQRKTPIWGSQNAILRYEPTWGDVDVLSDIIKGTAPANAAALNGMCTLATPVQRSSKEHAMLPRIITYRLSLIFSKSAETTPHFPYLIRVKRYFG